MIQQIFLDMDGVLSDFVGAICQRHQRPDPWVADPSLPHEDLQSVWGMGSAEFWQASDYNMWANMGKMPMADRIVDAAFEVAGVENVVILTSPTYRGSGCLEGKYTWLRNHFPRLADQMVITKRKDLLACPSRLLLDDFSKQVTTFRRAGGHAILCPAPHNTRRGVMATFDPLLEFKQVIKEVTAAAAAFGIA